MIDKITKRDGRVVPFDREKITTAVYRAAVAVGGRDREAAVRVTDDVLALLEARQFAGTYPSVEEVQDLPVAPSPADHVDRRIRALDPRGAEPLHRGRDPVPVLVPVSAPEVEQHRLVLVSSEASVDRALREDHQLSASPRVGLEGGGRHRAQILRLGHEDGPVAFQRSGVEVVRVELPIADEDHVELVPELRERLRERHVLRVRRGPSHDRPVHVHDREIVHRRGLLVEIAVRVDEADVLLQHVGSRGLPPGLGVDAGPPVVAPATAVRVGLEEHQLVVPLPLLAGELPGHVDARADPVRRALEGRPEPVPRRELAPRKDEVRLVVRDAVVVLHQDELEVRSPQAAPQGAERLHEVAEVGHVRADREARVRRVRVGPELGDERRHHLEGLALVERPVALEQGVIPPEAVEEGLVVGVGELGLAALPQVRAEPLEAAVAEPRPAGVAVHEPDAHHDLVEVHDVHAHVDAVLAAIQEVATERVAVDAGGVHGLALPVVPVALGRPAGDVAAGLVEQVLEPGLLVHPGDERDQRHREQHPPPAPVQLGHEVRVPELG